MLTFVSGSPRASLKPISIDLRNTHDCAVWNEGGTNHELGNWHRLAAGEVAKEGSYLMQTT